MEVPQLQRLHRAYFSRGLRVVGVTEMDPRPTAVVAFRRKFGLTYPLVFDPGERVGKRYRLEGHPTGVLVDRHGQVRYVHTGFLEGEEKQLEAAIRAVLAGQEPSEGDS